MENVIAETAACRRLRLTIDDHQYETDDRVLTGRQILDLANMRPPSDFVVLQFLPDGLLKEVLLDETTDLSVRGDTRFITFESDRVYLFILDDREFVWGAALITGATLKKLAGVDPQYYDVWQELHKADDRKIGDADTANLGEKVTERFFTAKKTTTEG